MDKNIVYICCSKVDQRITENFFVKKKESWAFWLRRNLVRYKIPRHINKGRSLDISRIIVDAEESLVNNGLPDDVKEILQKTSLLIIICSPQASHSLYIDTLIRYYKIIGGASRIQCLIIDGEPNSKKGRECFPQALRYNVDANGKLITTEESSVEPLAADISEGHDRVEIAIMRIVAGILGVDYDLLYERSRRLAFLKTAISFCLFMTVLFTYHQIDTYLWGKYLTAFSLDLSATKPSTGEAILITIWLTMVFWRKFFGDHFQTGEKYWAFISYSHKDAKANKFKLWKKTWGEWLHSNIEAYRIPWYFVRRVGSPRNFCKVFLDRLELPSSSNLSSNLMEALSRSRYLIVVCSTKSRESKYINEEVRYFRSIMSADKIICIVINGNASTESVHAQDSCYCPALWECFNDIKSSKPKIIDIRDFKRSNGILLEIVSLLADVKEQELSRQKRYIRIWQMLFASIVVLCLILLSYPWFLFVHQPLELAFGILTAFLAVLLRMLFFRDDYETHEIVTGSDHVGNIASTQGRSRE